MLLSLGMEWHSPSGVYETSRRVPEVRIWRCGVVPARRHAFGSAGFWVDPRSGEVLRDGFGRLISLDLENGRNA